MSEKTTPKSSLSRREFLKVSGATSAALSLVGIGAAGYAAGKDFDSYTGWEQIYEGGSQFFNRKAYEVDSPTYEVAGPTSRADNRVEGRAHFGKLKDAMKDGWVPEDGIDALPDYLADFYNKDPKRLENARYRAEVLEPLQIENRTKYNQQWEIAMAWGSAYGVTRPARPNTPPEEWDFDGIREEPLKFKSKDHASELIKKVAHTFGATLVGITKLNHDWVYGYGLRGAEDGGAYKVPSHWEYAIAITTPHEWDQMGGNPTYGTSSDAYNRSSIAAARIKEFIKKLGYPARVHSPNTSYDLLAVPVCVDAGIAEQGRHIFSIAPELGANHRPAVITTNMPMTIDKPIDFGVQDFCMSCKICADYCPSNAISQEDDARKNVRGYLRWDMDVDACYNFWGIALGNGGCRVCLAVCPYSRKANWVHNVARKISAADPTGIFDTGLIWMQETFFEGPEKEDYYPPNHPDGDGYNASYRPAPEWMQVEKWFSNVDVTW